MLSMARSIPQASASTKAGKWEKKKFLGSELRGKTLGIVGLGSIGREVVKRARAFEMRIIAHDPYVTSQTRQGSGRRAGGPALTLYAHSDYITLHVSLTPETDRLLNARSLRADEEGRAHRQLRARRTDRRRRAARTRMESGKVAGAALDVFAKEPTDAAYPLFAMEPVLATPHIGGSTEEAQEIVGVRIAEQMVEYLQNGVAINAVNMPALSPEQYKDARPVHRTGGAAGQFRAHIWRRAIRRLCG